MSSRIRFLLLLTPLYVGCEQQASERTAISVIVESDLQSGSELSSVSVRLTKLEEPTGGEPQVFALEPEPSGGRYALPFEFLLNRPDHKASEQLLVITGRGPDSAGNEADQVEYRTRVRFTPHKTGELRVFLARACTGVLCREQMEALTCDAATAACVPVSNAVVREPDSGVDMELDATVSEGGAADAQSSIDSGTTEASLPDAGCSSGKVSSSIGCVPDPCLTNPCLHNGACASNEGVAQCNCEGTGYSGSRCETDIDECATAMCPADYPCVQTEPPGYTCRGQFADRPMPDSTPGAKVAPKFDQSLPEATIDLVTGLTWQTVMPNEYPGCTGTMAPYVGLCTWEEAKKYCEGYRGLGQADWRLPTVIELLSIAQIGSVEGEAFYLSSVSLATYWTASPAYVASDSAWEIVSGGLYPYPKLLRNRVRCVRGTTRPPAGPRYAVSATEVKDLRTGLTWMKGNSGQVSFQGAEQFCKMQGLDWRVPTVKELLTLINYAAVPAGLALVDPDAFPGTPAAGFWSANAWAVEQPTRDNRLIVRLTTGTLHKGYFDEAALAAVRCVK